MTDASQRIVVLTSCTGVKAPSSITPLTQEDFARGPSRIDALRSHLDGELIPAHALYRGQQHLRLMAGVDWARERGLPVELLVASAGYGLIRADELLLPYECTFQGMRRTERRSWARRIGLPAAIRHAFARPYRLALVLLGEDYLEACRFETSFPLGGPTLVFCGGRAALKLPVSNRLTPIRLGQAEARRFSCGLVGLKGEVAARLLAEIAAHPQPDDHVRVAGLLDRLAAAPTVERSNKQMALTA